jgi:hypothetical protein
MMGWFSDLVGSFGEGISEAGSNATDYFTSPEGIIRLGSMGLGYLGSQSSAGQPQIQPTGYQGGIPALRAQRTQIPQMLGEEMSGGSSRPMDFFAPTGLGALTGSQGTGREARMMYEPNRRPGSSGRRYFTDTQYVAEDDDIAVADKRMAAQAAELSKSNIRRPPANRRGGSQSQQMAAGGIAGLEKGKYLNGSTDGMADRVPARIGRHQEARLSDGEFVIPADVVSHLGNGNSDAGAKVLEQMMGRVRKERTGNKKQGKEINPKTVLPV